MTPTMTFRTAAQAAIFSLELVGQFSDGHWENSSKGDWETWCDAETMIGADVGRDFSTTYDRYNLSAPALLNVVGGRMIGYARIANAFGFEFASALHWRIDCDGEFDVPKHEGEYWDEERTKITAALAKANLTLEQVRAALADESYGTKELKSDLREMKLAMKTDVR